MSKRVYVTVAGQKGSGKKRLFVLLSLALEAEGYQLINLHPTDRATNRLVAYDGFHTVDLECVVSPDPGEARQAGEVI